jgi:hypothetical protein
VVPGARAQVKFSQMTGPEYITYCASAATGQILTPHCSNSYQQLVDVAQAVVSNPQAFGAHHLQQLNDLCAPGPSSGPSCVTQLQNMADGYVEGLPPPSPQVARKDTCEGTLAPNAKSLFDTILPFTCLSDGHGGSCLVEVAQALDKAGACVAGASAVRARGNNRRVGGNILPTLGLPSTTRYARAPPPPAPLSVLNPSCASEPRLLFVPLRRAAAAGARNDGSGDLRPDDGWRCGQRDSLVSRHEHRGVLRE